VPRSSFIYSQLTKFVNSASISGLMAMLSAFVTTKAGAEVVAYLQGRKSNEADLNYDMKISAATMGTLGMIVTYPYQNFQGLPSTVALVERYYILAANLFVEIPVFVPLLINYVTREKKDFPEWYDLMIGGALVQCCSLIFGLLWMVFISEIGMKNERFVRAMHFFQELTDAEIQSPPEEIPNESVIESVKDPGQFYYQLKLNAIDENIFLADMAAMQKQVEKSFFEIQLMCAALIEDVHSVKHMAIQSVEVGSHRALEEIKPDFALQNADVKSAIKEQKLEIEELKPEVKQSSTESYTSKFKPKKKKKKKKLKAKTEQPDQAVIPIIIMPSLSLETKPELKSPPPPKEQAVEKSLELLTQSLNKSAFFQPAPATASLSLTLLPPVPPPAKDVLQVTLNEFENKVFALLDNLIPESDKQDKKYKTYIVGGWAYDKVRLAIKNIPPCPYNDIDLVTSIPPAILSSRFHRVREMNNLFSSSFHTIKIDIVYVPDLTDLSIDVKTRDFMLFYIDKMGKVFDPSNYAMANLLLGLHYGIKPVDTMFKEDPLEILRAIYLATKRDLDFENMKAMIINDRVGLIPRLQAENNNTHKYLDPRRMNLRLIKLFQQHHASANLDILFGLGIMETLFPTIYLDLLGGIHWVREQIANTNKVVWPKLIYIYATLIAPGIVHRNPNLAYDNNQAPAFDREILAIIDDVGKSNLLFQNQFGNPIELYNTLRVPLAAYHQYYLNIAAENLAANSLSNFRLA
jgi:tRNA nucleotidyltransferase/poly(A) polymerase